MRCKGLPFFVCVAEVGLDPDSNLALHRTHRVPSYDLNTLSDALENLKKWKFGKSQFSVLRHLFDRKYGMRERKMPMGGQVSKGLVMQRRAARVA